VLNCKVTREHIRRQEAIYGKLIAGIKGRTTKKKSHDQIDRDAARDFPLEFGAYMQATVGDGNNSMAQRTEGGIYLGPSDNSSGSVRMLKLSNREVVERDHYQVLPMPDEVIRAISAQAERDGFSRDMQEPDGDGDDDGDDDEAEEELVNTLPRMMPLHRAGPPPAATAVSVVPPAIDMTIDSGAGVMAQTPEDAGVQPGGDTAIEVQDERPIADSADTG
jgi:hypothetical protein